VHRETLESSKFGAVEIRIHTCHFNETSKRLRNDTIFYSVADKPDYKTTTNLHEFDHPSYESAPNSTG
jgi:hypothetical protein